MATLSSSSSSSLSSIIIEITTTTTIIIIGEKGEVRKLTIGPYAEDDFVLRGVIPVRKGPEDEQPGQRRPRDALRLELEERVALVALRDHIGSEVRHPREHHRRRVRVGDERLLHIDREWRERRGEGEHIPSAGGIKSTCELSMAAEVMRDTHPRRSRLVEVPDGA